jgi:hypothetical protein
MNSRWISVMRAAANRPSVTTVPSGKATAPAWNEPTWKSRWLCSFGIAVLSISALLTPPQPSLAGEQPSDTTATEPATTEPASTGDATPPTFTPPETLVNEQLQEKVSGAIAVGEKAVQSAATAVDQDPRAQQATAGILQPIYQVAEALNFSAFYWLAFAIMATGVVSYALQLVLGKLVVLTQLHFSLGEILSDSLGLVTSIVGLVLTTQAATENSQFTQSPAAVLSATAVGVIAGLMFYWMGQAQELRAARAANHDSRVGVKR